MVDHPKVALVSATGSTRMGREVGPRLAKRFARAILELGGNNAGIVCPSADLDMALRAIAFGAMGTAGQRCTTLRRLFVHDSVYDALLPRLRYADDSTTPLFPGTHLCTSIRPHMLSWARCNNHVIPVNHSGWTMNGQPGGSFITWPGAQEVFICSDGVPAAGPAKNHGGGHVRLLRNGREIQTFDSWGLNFARLIRLPDPGAAWDWYNLELENSNGCRFTTAPIYVLGQQRTGKVSIPFLLQDKTVQECQIEAVRVPFFHYPCQRDTGGILRDVSGYEHHGRIGGKGYGGGHLQQTGYRHEHKGPVGALPPADPDFTEPETLLLED